MNNGKTLLLSNQTINIERGIFHGTRDNHDSIISIAAIVIIEYYQTASNKVVAAECDKSKRVCRIRSETTHFGGYLPVHSYYFIPYPVYGAGLGIYSPGLGLQNRSDCDRCLDSVTDRDEQQIITSKSPVPESELSSQKHSRD
jgi:hypothetical protein